LKYKISDKLIINSMLLYSGMSRCLVDCWLHVVLESLRDLSWSMYIWAKCRYQITIKHLTRWLLVVIVSDINLRG